MWTELAERGVGYMEREMLPQWDWEGQFEDAKVSCRYSNLAHFAAGSLLRWYAEHRRDDAEAMACAGDLMRFIEDQFLVWKRPSPWTYAEYGETSLWYLPAGLEQYNWHVPIDSSTAAILLDFLAMYKATGDELYLAKAKALGDQITRMQQPDGMIPTHWMKDEYVTKPNMFWINCHLATANALAELDSFLNGAK